jgi:hypothetical protein
VPVLVYSSFCHTHPGGNIGKEKKEKNPRLQIIFKSQIVFKDDIHYEAAQHKTCSDLKHKRASCMLIMRIEAKTFNCLCRVYICIVGIK